MQRSIKVSRRRTLSLASIGCLAVGMLASHQAAHAQAGGTIIDDNDPRVVYSGTWERNAGTGYEFTLNGIHRSNVPGSKATLTFTGTSITYLYSKAFNRGRYRVTLCKPNKPDRTECKVLESGLSALSTPSLRQVGRTWAVSTLPESHVVEIELLPPADPRTPANANYADLDAFVIDLPPARAGTTTDDSSSLIRYTGGWVHQVNVPGAYAGTNSYSGQPGAHAWFPFNGDKLTYYYSAAPNRGYVQVTIDGRDRKSFSQYSATLQRQQSISFEGLGPGPHVVHIAVTGQKVPAATDPFFIDIDRLDAIESSGSLSYFIQKYSSEPYSDTNGTVPGDDVVYHAVRVNLDDPLVTVYPQGANNAKPAELARGRWNPSADNRQLIGEMYFNSPARDKRVLISTDSFCDGYPWQCAPLDPGAPKGLFIRPDVSNAAVADHVTTHPLIFRIRDALMGYDPVEPLPPGTRNAVAGGPRILSNGVLDCSSDVTGRCGAALQRRNGACLSPDGRTLYLMATGNGETTTWRNLASFMSSLGCSNGMQFVGGRSTGLVVEGEVKVTPDAAIGTGLVISSPQTCTAGLCLTSTPVRRPDSKE